MGKTKIPRMRTKGPSDEEISEARIEALLKNSRESLRELNKIEDKEVDFRAVSENKERLKGFISTLNDLTPCVDNRAEMLGILNDLNDGIHKIRVFCEKEKKKIITTKK